MLGFRAYIIGPDEHIVDRVELLCESEEEAKQRAKQLVDGHAVELRDRARKIARYEPEQ